LNKHLHAHVRLHKNILRLKMILNNFRAILNILSFLQMVK
jgi:hypothetical protein